MKVVFKGVTGVSKSGGCARCGQSAKTSKRLITEKEYHMPSGNKVLFKLGIPVEVSESDGAWLLDYIEKTKDGTRKIFDKV